MEQTKHPKIFNEIYSLRRKINSGSFGTVYLGFNDQKKEHVAIKIESKIEGDVRTVLREASIMKKLHGIKGVPEIYWSGTENNCDVLVQKLLGKDLASLMKTYKRMSLKTVVMIAEQLIKLFEKMHELRVVHRDIKPDNIIMGRSTDYETVYLIDFGIAKYYMNEEGLHIKQKENKPFIGTTRYASFSAHLGKELSRKDDLESLGYVFIFLLKGSLPWQNAIFHKNDNKEKIKAVGMIKLKMKTEELCKGLPNEFKDYFEHIKSLKFEDKPDYHKLRYLFIDLAIKEKIVIDFEWDWFPEVKKRIKAGTHFTLDTFYRPRLIDNKSADLIFPPRNSKGSIFENLFPESKGEKQQQLSFAEPNNSMLSISPIYDRSFVSNDEGIS